MAERDVAGFAKCPAQKGRQTAPGSSVYMPSGLSFQRNGRGAPQALGKEEERGGVEWRSRWGREQVGRRQLPQKETEAGRMEEWRRKWQRPKDVIIIGAAAKFKGGCRTGVVKGDRVITDGQT